MLGILLAVSTAVWFVIDRLKLVFPQWGELSWGNWLTTGIVAGLSAIAVATYNLDLFVACEITEAVTFFGCLMSVLVITGGSSCIAEIIKKIKGTSE